MENLRTLYRTVLEEKGPFEVVAEAGDGRTGIEAAQEHDPDLVLLDLSMPDMDGLEALPEIRKASPGASVVVLSGFLDQRVGEEARELGASDFIEKGVDADELVERVADVAEVDVPEPEPEFHEVDLAPEAKNGAAGEEIELLSRGIRHDLKEPLRIVTSYLELLEDRYRDDLPPDAREFIDHATDGAERMEEMIEALGEYRHIDEDVEPRGEVDLEAVLDDIVDNLEDRLGGDVTLERGDLPAAVGDHGNVMRVLQNLVGNALDYTDEGQVLVEAREEGDRLVVTVADDGPGVPEGEQDEIFNPLKRGSAGLETDGAGMGLAISKRIVESHGGSIGVESEPGKGATFWFTLPKHPEAGGQDP